MIGEVRMSKSIKGDCFICGYSGAKIAMKNHILKEHNEGEEKCYLIKAEGVYEKGYWLYFSIPLDASLLAIDKFLRKIWCECCGHLSAFRLGREKIPKSSELSLFSTGDKLLYEYDFGSTTEIMITITEELLSPIQKEKARLIARNKPLSRACEKCELPASYFEAYEREIICEKCAANEFIDECYLLPITNSPRSGECGYDGELDQWTFEEMIER